MEINKAYKKPTVLFQTRKEEVHMIKSLQLYIELEMERRLHLLFLFQALSLLLFIPIQIC